MTYNAAEANKYFFWAALIILIIVAYLVIKPFIIALISAFILAYLIRPVHIRIKKKLGSTLASFLSVFLVVLIIIIPFFLIIAELTKQISSSLDKETLSSIIKTITSLPFLEKIDIQTSQFAESALSFALTIATSLIKSLPTIIISIIITLLGIYYILNNWEILTSKISSYVPFKNKERIISDMSKATSRIIYGYALVAIIEFIVAAIGFYILGVNHAIFFAALIGFLAFIPGAGPMLAWLPLALYYFFTSASATGIGIIIIGLIVSVGIDNFLAPHLVGKASKIHPFIMLLGIFGGIPVFGIFGFIIGPLVLVYTLEILEEIIQNK